MYQIVENPPPRSPLWASWKHEVDHYQWTSDDNSVTKLTPLLPSTRSVFAVCGENHGLIGTVIWNEYDGFSFVGFYLVTENYRGLGIGLQIWKAAIKLMAPGSNIVLRAVPVMEAKYRSMNTPFVNQELTTYKAPINQFQEILTTKLRKTGEFLIKNVSELCPDEWEQMMNYDKLVTRRDRSEFLTMYHKLIDFTISIAAFTPEGQICGFASVVPTTFDGSHNYKLAPVYAESDDAAFVMIRQATTQLQERDPEANVLVHLLGKLDKQDLLAQALDSCHRHVSGITLSSRTLENPIDFSKVYIPHNNSCHYDA